MMPPDMRSPSALNYFRTAAHRLSESEDKLGMYHIVVLRASLIVAAQPVKDGMGNVEVYLPSLNQIVANLGLFRLGVAQPTLPNDHKSPYYSLECLAESVSELGMRMRQVCFVQAGGVDEVSPSATMVNVAGSLINYGVDMREFAATGNFSSRDLSSIVELTTPAFELAEMIAACLITESLIGRLEKGRQGRMDYLRQSLVKYTQSFDEAKKLAK